MQSTVLRSATAAERSSSDGTGRRFLKLRFNEVASITSTEPHAQTSLILSAAMKQATKDTATSLTRKWSDTNNLLRENRPLPVSILT
jgi:hypothetical protein